MSKTNRKTLQDVAHKVGVSVTTVAKVLAGQAQACRISQQTADRVRQAATQIGYVPSSFARHLRTRRSGLIGIFLSDNTDPIPAAILHAVLENLHEQGIFPVLTMAETGVAKSYETWQQNRVEGVIFCGANAQIKPSLLAKLEQNSIRSVLAGNYCYHPTIQRALDKTATVLVDDRAGIQLAIDHLVAQGRSRIAHITGPDNFYDAVARKASYEEFITPLHRPMIVDVPNKVKYWERGFVGAQELLKDRVSRLDALIAYDDPAAMGAIKYFSEKGIKVPHDIAVVGFDNQPEAQYAIPSLTSVHQPVTQIGRQSVLLLKKMLDTPADPEHLLLSPELIARSSTACKSVVQRIT